MEEHRLRRPPLDKEISPSIQSFQKNSRTEIQRLYNLGFPPKGKPSKVEEAPSYNIQSRDCN